MRLAPPSPPHTHADTHARERASARAPALNRHAALHVACGVWRVRRYLADDRTVISVGGHDRGIYQWKTCGMASGLPPIPVIMRKIKEAEVRHT